MMRQNSLFVSGRLSEELEQRIEAARRYVDELPADSMNATTDEELSSEIIERLQTQPLVVDFDRVAHEPRSSEGSRSQPIELVVTVPFTGDPSLFTFRPSVFSSNPPRGAVLSRGPETLDGELRFLYSTTLTERADDDFMRWWGEQRKSLTSCVDQVNQDVNAFNAKLPGRVLSMVIERRATLQARGALLDRITLRMPRREGAPAPTPVKMQKRIVKPPTRSRPVEQEYTIAESDYDYILRILRHESRSFEQMPATFRKLTEPELRDVVIAHLNGHFAGDASGERFRGKGKTDICIEFANRAAFVAECKVWSGPKSLIETIDQLSDYITWRDCRVALVFLNKHIKAFSEMQKQVPITLAEHPRFAKLVDSGQPGEWRVKIKAEGDDARLTTIHVFLVDLSR